MTLSCSRLQADKPKMTRGQNDDEAQEDGEGNDVYVIVQGLLTFLLLIAPGHRSPTCSSLPLHDKLKPDRRSP